MAATNVRSAGPGPFHHWLAWLIAGLLFAALLVPLIHALTRFAPPAGRYQLDFQRLELPAAPKYVPATFLEEVRSQAQLPERLDPRQPDLAAQLADAFRRHPWVESVEQVALQPRGRVTVQLTYRTPVAAVEPGSPGHSCLVDRRGVLLPPSPGFETGANLLKITGAPTSNARPGLPWGSAAVEAAAQLAALVQAERERLGIASIAMGTNALTPELRLRTRRGTEVIWQSLDARQSGDEAEPGEKLRRLLAYCAEYGSLDKPAGPYLLDVRPAGGLLRSSPR